MSSERTSIGTISIDQINGDLRQFRDLSTQRDRRGMDHYARHSVIHQPHAIMIFEDVGEYRIAQGSLTNHPQIEQTFNYSRTIEGKPASKKMVSGVVFSTKESPHLELIRLDHFHNDLSENAHRVVEHLEDNGYVIFDALFQTLEEKGDSHNVAD